MIQTKESGPDPAKLLQMMRLDQDQRIEKMVLLLNTIISHLGDEMSSGDIIVLMNNSTCTTAALHQLAVQDIEAMDLTEAAKNSLRSLSLPPQACESFGCITSSSYILVPSTP